MKTLKDLDLQICEKGDIPEDCLCVPNFKKELQQVAREWIVKLRLKVKEINEKIEACDCAYCPYCEEDCGCEENMDEVCSIDGKIGWIKEFFNLEGINNGN